MIDFLASDPTLFIAGCVVTIVTITAVLLVGQAEAEDPAHNRPVRESD